MRIRTIKPEFWRSTDISQLTRDLRLLFVGLWSYVDDNGVGVDDHRQIAADLFPLDDDPLEARDFVREGLATLSRHSLIERYEVAGKSYLFIRTWDQHQKVDKPNKARHPRPGAVTSKNKDETEGSRESRDDPEPVTGEQGNRGTGEPAPAELALVPSADLAVTAKPRTLTQRCQAITKSYYDVHGSMTHWNGVQALVKAALNAGWDDEKVEAALLRLHEQRIVPSKGALEYQLNGSARGRGRPTASQRAQRTLEQMQPEGRVATA